MYTRKNLCAAFAALMIALSANAQLFETRTTQFGGQELLNKFNENGTAAQKKIRDSVMNQQRPHLPLSDVIEIFFDDYHLGLVIYRNKQPHQLLGFWQPDGTKIWGGSLNNGNGVVRTPFNPSLIQNFKYEKVTYKNGMKNGPTFYYCDCASVLRRGQFTDNQKEGLWMQYTPAGEFVEQKEIRIEKIPIEIILDEDWKRASHCMMRNPNEDIKCPTDK